jgi:hypothetical protein
MLGRPKSQERTDAAREHLHSNGGCDQNMQSNYLRDSTRLCMGCVEPVGIFLPLFYYRDIKYSAGWLFPCLQSVADALPGTSLTLRFFFFNTEFHTSLHMNTFSQQYSMKTPLLNPYCIHIGLLFVKLCVLTRQRLQVFLESNYTRSCR